MITIQDGGHILMKPNPCKECIVNPMCQVPCDTLVDFLIEHLPDPESHNWMYGTIALNLRRGLWRLIYLEKHVLGVAHNEKSM